MGNYIKLKDSFPYLYIYFFLTNKNQEMIEVVNDILLTANGYIENESWS